MDSYPIWISFELMKNAVINLREARKNLRDKEINLDACEDILGILNAEKTIAVCIAKRPDNPSMLSYRALGGTHSAITSQTGIFFIRLLGFQPTDVIQGGSSILQIWSQGDEIVLDPGDLRVAEYLGTSHIPSNIDKASVKARKIVIAKSSNPHRMNIDFLVGLAIETVYLPETTDKREVRQIKNLLDSYQLRIQQGINQGSHKAIRDNYAFVKAERNNLYDRLMKLGWRFMDATTHVYDTRFQEWNPEKNRWNVHRVSANFMKIGTDTR